MIMQVHDELVFEIKENIVEEIKKQIKHIMENVVTLLVPVKVDIHSGKNWGEIH